jgi:galactokinase
MMSTNNFGKHFLKSYVLKESDYWFPLIERHGLEADICRRHAAQLSACGEALLTHGLPEMVNVQSYFVPGRIEILGKHTDYCGGYSLLAVPDRGFAFVAVSTAAPGVTMIDAISSEHTEFIIEGNIRPRRRHWSNYPMTVARRLARNFSTNWRGAVIAFASDLPSAAGMSSSSALIVGTFMTLARLHDLQRHPDYQTSIRDQESLADYLASIECGADFGSLAGDIGVGTHGGSEDHTAILCSRANTLSLYSYRPTSLRRHLPLPEDLVFCIASSGIAAEKTGDTLQLYNRASQLAQTVVELWRSATGHDVDRLATIIESAPCNVERMHEILRTSRHGEFSTQELIGRFDHFVAENDTIIPSAVDCLENGDLAGFGSSVDRSQHLGASLLGNQVEETVFLAQQARQLGAVAASAFGAGFGGSVWSLVHSNDADNYLEAWKQTYERTYPARTDESLFFKTSASLPAFSIT